jgi:glycosyltransferase involved in cell wall biosynthesis
MNLPRLLYIGYTPVENTCAGMVLLHRLFSRYPAGKLMVFQCLDSPIDKRLPGVKYFLYQKLVSRLIRSRFRKLATLGGVFLSTFTLREVNSKCKEFAPEAIITVSHGVTWYAAALLAKKLNLPLYIVCYDDWLEPLGMPPLVSRWLEKQFAHVYRQARLRFCVSPYMADYYEKLYGVPGAIMFPSRSAESPEFECPPATNRKRPFTMAFAGSIGPKGYIEALILLAEYLQNIGGKLLIYSPLNSSFAVSSGLARENISIMTFVPSETLITTLREEADALFVPMSHDQGINSEISFPSKIADYTITGLPLLIYGPANSSAVRWAQENSGVAEVANYNDKNSLQSAVTKLAEDVEYRMMLGTNALEIGYKYFAYENVMGTFFELFNDDQILLRSIK